MRDQLTVPRMFFSNDPAWNRELYQAIEQQMQREMNEQTRTGRSGFWTSPYPAQHGAYRYRLLILGIGIASIMGFTAWRLVKRTQPPQRR